MTQALWLAALGSGVVAAVLVAWSVNAANRSASRIDRFVSRRERAEGLRKAMHEAAELKGERSPKTR